MSKILKFKRPLAEEDRLSMSRGQRNMILEYLENCMANASDSETEERFSHVWSLVYAFCQEEEASKAIQRLRQSQLEALESRKEPQ